MGKSHLVSLFVLVNAPQVMHNSHHANTTTVWFDVTDIQSGTTAKHLISSSFQFGTASYFMWAACSHPGISVGQHCWQWEHSIQSCHAQALYCPWYAGPHTEASHCLHTSCCYSNPSANPSQEVTPERAPCSHAPWCTNCKGEHAALV
ncbi:hypothetical protein AN958_09810 [Leucoagaricus sp. SymC.cos]|nr:hypothetical protein AN958_09810 [Leucoagaricus sp. SymC.cos]